MHTQRVGQQTALSEVVDRAEKMVDQEKIRLMVTLECSGAFLSKVYRVSDDHDFVSKTKGLGPSGK